MLCVASIDDSSRVRECCVCLISQVPWDEEFTWPCARELFGSNLLVLTWIKGEPLPGELVDDILKALGLGRDTLEERCRRRTSASDASARFGRSRSSIERLRDEESDDEDDGDL